MKNKEIAKLVKKLQSGDEKAFVKIYDATAQIVFHYCYKCLNNSQDAEDATQEVYCKVFTRIGKLENPEAFNKWLSLFMVEVCSTYRRKKQPVTGDVEIGEVSDMFTEEKSDYLPVEALENKELRKEVLDVIDDLPYKQKQAVLLFYYQNLSVREISEVTESSENAVLNCLYTARQKMRKVINVADGAAKNGKAKKMLGMAPFLFNLFEDEASAVFLPVKDKIWSGISQNLGVSGKPGSSSSSSAGAGAGAGAGATTLAVAGVAIGIAAMAASVGVLGYNLVHDDTAGVDGGQVSSIIAQEVTNYDIIEKYALIESIEEYFAFCDEYGFQQAGGTVENGENIYYVAILFRSNAGNLMIGINDSGGFVTKVYEEDTSYVSAPDPLTDWFVTAEILTEY